MAELKKAKTKTIKRKGGGGKLSRSEIVQVRLDPKLKFAAELAARKHRRTLSSFIEWTISECVQTIKVGQENNETAHFVANQVWHPKELTRFIFLAREYPYSLTYDEEMLWDLLCETEYYWLGKWDSKQGLGLKKKKAPVHLNVPMDLWDEFKKCIEGSLDKSDLFKQIQKTRNKYPILEQETMCRD